MSSWDRAETQLKPRWNRAETESNLCNLLLGGDLWSWISRQFEGRFASLSPLEFVVWSNPTGENGVQFGPKWRTGALMARCRWNCLIVSKWILASEYKFYDGRRSLSLQPQFLSAGSPDSCRENGYDLSSKSAGGVWLVHLISSDLTWYRVWPLHRRFFNVRFAKSLFAIILFSKHRPETTW